MVNRTRFSLVSVFVLLATLLLSACGGTTNTPEAGPTNTPGGAVQPTAAITSTNATKDTGNKPTQPAGQDEKLVRIGFAFALTGDNGANGKSQRQAAELAWHEIDAAGGINGFRIAATFDDTAGKPDKALTVYQKQINGDNVLTVVGPTLSSEATTTDPEAQKIGCPVLAVSNPDSGITDIGDFIFRASLADSQVIPETVKQAKEKLGISKVAILYDKDDASSKSSYDTFKAELQKNSVQVVNEQTFADTDTDYKTQLTAIKGANPDAIVVSAPAKSVLTILQQSRNDVKIDSKVHIIGNSSFNSTALIKAAGPAAEGLVVGGAWNINASDDLSKNFIANFKKTYGRDPDEFAAQSYAGLYILADAIKRANVTGLTAKTLKDDRVKVRDALKATKDVDTVLGKFSFTDKRDASYSPVVQVVKDGKLEILK